ncbi:hypothetical protein G6F40_015526 [Rhizopus arrhizus]|nr:hypothetical protein G6F40_015526 [Rhizopus arrhizus]
MEAGLDTGPVLLHQELPIAATDTGAVRWPGPAACRHQADRTAAAGAGRDLCAQAGQGRSCPGLHAAGRTAGTPRARLQPGARRQHPLARLARPGEGLACAGAGDAHHGGTRPRAARRCVRHRYRHGQRRAAAA